MEKHEGKLMRMFPIMEKNKGQATTEVPWAFMAPHNRNAEDNHSQTLERLAERGGLSPGEALDVVTGQRWATSTSGIGEAESEKRLLDLVAHWTLQRVRELESLLDTPHTGEFFESVKREAAHQVKRFGTDHDAGKDPADWFWLVGFLLGKALSKPEKRKHHIISSAAVLLNWYRRETGDADSFQPGAGIEAGA